MSTKIGNSLNNQEEESSGVLYLSVDRLGLSMGWYRGSRTKHLIYWWPADNDIKMALKYQGHFY